MPFTINRKKAGRCGLVLIDTNIVKDGANWLTNTDMRHLVFRSYDKSLNGNNFLHYSRDTVKLESESIKKTESVCEKDKMKPENFTASIFLNFHVVFCDRQNTNRWRIGMNYIQNSARRLAEYRIAAGASSSFFCFFCRVLSFIIKF